jgi:hypothetical protein
MSGGGQGGDNKDEKDKKVWKQDRIDFFVLTIPSTEGQAQVRATSTTNNQNRPEEAQGSWSECISKATRRIPYLPMQAKISPDATNSRSPPPGRRIC